MCRLCGGALHFLGALGHRMHLRCRACGVDISREAHPGELDGGTDGD